MQGKIGSMSAMAREAIDAYLKTKTQLRNPYPVRPTGRTPHGTSRTVPSRTLFVLPYGTRQTYYNMILYFYKGSRQDSRRFPVQTGLRIKTD